MWTLAMRSSSRPRTAERAISTLPTIVIRTRGGCRWKVPAPQCPYRPARKLLLLSFLRSVIVMDVMYCLSTVFSSRKEFDFTGTGEGVGGPITTMGIDEYYSSRRCSQSWSSYRGAYRTIRVSISKMPKKMGNGKLSLLECMYIYWLSSICMVSYSWHCNT